MNTFIKTISIISILGGILVTIYFLNELSDEYQVLVNEKILLPETGQVGDFIGGVIGTVFFPCWILYFGFDIIRTN
ncbi:MAG: hypothetical protein ACJA2C_002543 [Marinoscillum sp.]|jgi:hypothetical protein